MRVITICAEDDPASAALVRYAKDIANELRAAQVRVSTDFGNNPIKAKIQDAEVWFGVPRLRGSDRLKAELQTSRVQTAGS